jgi:hypothetical protein
VTVQQGGSVALLDLMMTIVIPLVMVINAIETSMNHDDSLSPGIDVVSQKTHVLSKL